MAFDDYSPQDRRLTGRAHIGPWLIFALLIGLLAIVGPETSSGSSNDHIAMTTSPVQDDCAV